MWRLLRFCFLTVKKQKPTWYINVREHLHSNPEAWLLHNNEGQVHGHLVRLGILSEYVQYSQCLQDFN